MTGIGCRPSPLMAGKLGADEIGITGSVTGRGLSVTCIGLQPSLTFTESGLIASHLGRYLEHDIIGPAEPPQ